MYFFKTYFTSTTFLKAAVNIREKTNLKLDVSRKNGGSSSNNSSEVINFLFNSTNNKVTLSFEWGRRGFFAFFDQF